MRVRGGSTEELPAAGAGAGAWGNSIGATPARFLIWAMSACVEDATVRDVVGAVCSSFVSFVYIPGGGGGGGGGVKVRVIG